MNQIDELRALALQYLDLATDGDRGRGEADPIYQAITEGRDRGAFYSSCGDLAHWLLFRLGVRHQLVNRAEGRGWRVGRNISRLCWSNPYVRPPRPGERYRAGDILVVWNDPTGTDAHALVVREHVGSLIHSADYGQPGGAQRARLLSRGMLGDRKLNRVLPLARVIDGERAAGALAPAQSVADWIAEISGTRSA